MALRNKGFAQRPNWINIFACACWRYHDTIIRINKTVVLHLLQTLLLLE